MSGRPVSMRLPALAAGSVALVMLPVLAACGSDGAQVPAGAARVEGSGEIIIDSRVIDDFSRVTLAGEGRVVFGEGADGSIEIEIDADLAELVETDVVDDELVIATRSGVDIDPSTEIVYRLGCPSLTAVTLSGAGVIDPGACTTDASLRLDLPGAGSVTATQLAVEHLEVRLAGAGKVEAAGTADRLEVALSGAGGFKGDDLRATAVRVASSGVGRATVWAVERLDIDLSGVGQVRYYGDPERRETVTGVGGVQSLGDK